MQISRIQEHPENLAIMHIGVHSHILGIPKITVVFHINTCTMYQQCEEGQAKMITGPFLVSLILK